MRWISDYVGMAPQLLDNMPPQLPHTLAFSFKASPGPPLPAFHVSHLCQNVGGSGQWLTGD